MVDGALLLAIFHTVEFFCIMAIYNNTTTAYTVLWLYAGLEKLGL